MSRNVDKGREAENATAEVFRAAGCAHAERRAKRGGYVELDGERLHRDAGDLTGIPGVVVQVKWSPYAPLSSDLAATERQRKVAGADVGLLVVKRRGVGLSRAAEWDAYLPTWQVAELMVVWQGPTVTPDPVLPELRERAWRTDLWTAARLIALAGYGSRPRAHAPV